MTYEEYESILWRGDKTPEEDEMGEETNTRTLAADIVDAVHTVEKMSAYQNVPADAVEIVRKAIEDYAEEIVTRERYEARQVSEAQTHKIMGLKIEIEALRAALADRERDEKMLSCLRQLKEALDENRELRSALESKAGAK